MNHDLEALDSVIDQGRDHVATATLQALSELQRKLKGSNVPGEDQLALILHTATIFAVESLHMVIRSIGEGTAEDHEEAMRTLLTQVCADRAGARKYHS